MSMIRQLFGARESIAQVRDRRADRLRREGSPYYRTVCGIIAASASQYIYPDSAHPGLRKYGVPDWYEIVNDSTEDLTATINGTKSFKVPAGTTRSDDDMPVRSFNVANDDAVNATTAGEITVAFRVLPLTMDKAVREGLI